MRCSVGRFDDLRALGERLVKDGGAPPEAIDALNQLQERESALKQLWEETDRSMQDAVDLHAFMAKADQLEQLSRDHRAFLERTDPQVGYSPWPVYRWRLWWATLARMCPRRLPHACQSAATQPGHRPRGG